MDTEINKFLHVIVVNAVPGSLVFTGSGEGLGKGQKNVNVTGCGGLKRCPQIFDIPAFKMWSLSLLPLSVGCI